MKTMLVALAFALGPLNVAQAPSPVHAGSSKAPFGVAAERPTICFEFAFWKYCI
jgi:hypothetical protein